MRMLPALSVALLEAVPVKMVVFPSADIAPFGVGKALSKEAMAGEPEARVDSEGPSHETFGSPQSRALIRYKNKRGVLVNGAAERSAKSLWRSGARGSSAFFAEPIVRVKHIIAEVFKHTSVPIVGSRPRG